MDESINFETVTTRGGDRGESSLFNGDRLRKDDLIFHLLGDLDELSSHLGLARAGNHSLDIHIEPVQRLLIRLCAMIATPFSDKRYKTLKIVDESDLHSLELQEKNLLKITKVKPVFILPGGSLTSARLDIARCICRKCERNTVTCIRERSMLHLIPCQVYLNRLSDFLFVLARRYDSIKEENTHA